MEMYYDDFSIRRNEDGSDFTINQHDNEKNEKKPKQLPKQQKPENKNRKETSPKKPAADRPNGGPNSRGARK
jgi:hypothetical protein